VLKKNFLSHRNLFDINKYLWGSWMIQVGNENIYFAGDSAYGEHYKQIASQFGNIDLALMPIGPVGPREIVKKAHMDAQEAVHAFIDLNAKKFTPIHWGTFALGTDAFDTALNQLSLAITENASDLDAKNLQILKFGECIGL
jgi:L-ascorbate metabolism protein UlaG (beta-lactamase superfamily)